ncbi:MAG TPA: winged helix-turn-helix domain-containing protein [Dehalococcoidia bacterium]|nr:winged helix-turn-helix domain-containing protein [Dehalococcoidia bacterium]
MIRKVELGNLTLDLDRYEVRIDGRLVQLTFVEFELLSYFSRHPDKVISPEQLLDSVWSHHGGTEKLPAGGNDEGRLRVAVSRLRKKIDKSSPWQIETVRRRGYAFTSQPARRPGAPGFRHASGDARSLRVVGATRGSRHYWQGPAIFKLRASRESFLGVDRSA